MTPVVIVLGCALFAAGPVAGASDREARAKAGALVKRGNAHFDAKRFKDALAFYQEAERVFPSKKIEFNLAETHRQLGHLAIAETLYERFLEDTQAGLAKFQHGAHARLDDMRQHGGRVAIRGDLHQGRVAIDGGVPFDLPEHPLLLLPGKHALVITQGAHDAFETSVDVKRGETVAVDIDPPPVAEPVQEPVLKTPLLAPRPEPVPMAETLVPPAPEPTPEPAITERWWFWAGVSAAVLGGVTAVALVRSQGGGGGLPSPELGSTHVNTWHER